MEKLSTQPYKGTRDFYPEEMILRNWFFGKIKSVLKNYTYEEYNGPMLEPLELYAAKSGQEIVNEQTYNFIDRGGRSLAVRPEMTPTVARMVAGKLGELSMPLRWFSIPNLYRYEKPQRGRLREHWQINVDLFGCDTVEADLEIINIAISLLKSFGANENMFKVKINNRKFFNDIFKNVLKLNNENSIKASKAIDRKNKVPREVYFEDLKILGLSDENIQLIDNLFEMPVLEAIKVCEDSEGAKELKGLFEMINKMNLNNYCEFDFSVIRGLDYYTGTVFEVFDESPENRRAMFGGGRYDNLIGLFSNNASVSGIGFGFGDVTLENFLTIHNLIPDIISKNEKILITRFDDVEYTEYVKLAEEIRNQGINVSIFLGNKKFGKQIEYALKERYTHIIVMGSSEIEDNEFVIKDLIKREERKIKREEKINLNI